MRCVQKPIKFFKGPINICVMMLVVFKQNVINWIETCFLTSVVIYYKSVTLGGSTEHLTTYHGLEVKLVSMSMLNRTVNMVCK